MDKIIIQLGRLGDIVNVLPIAYAASKRGERTGIMACSEFASVLDGCNYVEKIVFDGKPWQIPEAFEQAKKLCPNVVVAQVNAPVEEVLKNTYRPAGQEHAVTDSFCRESWKIAGCLSDWGKAPLVFDKRDRAREDALMPKNWFGKGKKKRIMLVSSGSSSSPFPYRNLLMEMLTLKYPNFNIIDLSTVRSERFYDLLGLYEAAHCLVTVDTAHLHLATAVPSLPVMALIQDRFQGKESYWHGSAWRPQHKFHCRYHDFPHRALELFTAIDEIGKEPISNILQVYYGGLRQNNGVRYFAIQNGSCRRDAVNVLGDREHFPMLPDVIRMVMQVAKPSEIIILTREDTKHNFSGCDRTPSYAYRMNRDRNGNDTFFPAADLFAAPVDFWVKVFPELPDVVVSIDSYWPRILVEIFKTHNAREIEGIYRNDF